MDAVLQRYRRRGIDVAIRLVVVRGAPILSIHQSRVERLERMGDARCECSYESETRVLGRRCIAGRYEQRFHKSWPARCGYIRKFVDIMNKGKADVADHGDKVSIERTERGAVAVCVSGGRCLSGNCGEPGRQSRYHLSSP